MQKPLYYVEKILHLGNYILKNQRLSCSSMETHICLQHHMELYFYLLNRCLIALQLLTFKPEQIENET